MGDDQIYQDEDQNDPRSDGSSSQMIRHMKCNCRIWPLVFPNPVGTCGLCGERPHTLCTDEEVEEYYESRR